MVGKFLARSYFTGYNSSLKFRILTKTLNDLSQRRPRVSIPMSCFNKEHPIDRFRSACVWGEDIMFFGIKVRKVELLEFKTGI